MIFRFNYTEHRELFDVFNREGRKRVSLYSQAPSLDTFIDPITKKPNNGVEGCSLGDYYIDYDI